MAKTSSLVLLVKSLTKAEKRYFKLYSSVQDGSKNYMLLFDIVDKLPQATLDDIKKAFHKKIPGASFEISSKYLYELLTDALVHLKNKEQDEVIRMNHSLSVIKVLFDKSLVSEAFSELQKLKKLALKRDNKLVMLNALLTEMEYVKSLDFADLSEKDLVQHQMQIAAAIKSVNYTQQHTALYQLIRHRMIHKGNARTVKQKEELNDLVVSEMSIMANPALNNFESKKTHLLFQSTYCLLVGDYRSALITFSELNALFENNANSWKGDPADYLSCLEGILDSLQTIDRYTEMDAYLVKIEALPDSNSETALLKLRLLFIYKAARAMHSGSFEDGIELIRAYKMALLEKMGSLSFDKQSGVHLHVSLLYLSGDNSKGAVKYLNRVLLDNAVYYNHAAYKTLRLVRLLAQHDLGNTDFVAHEVKLLKRQLSAKAKTYQLEKLMFGFLQQPLQRMTPRARRAYWEKIKPEFEQLGANKLETKIVKVFNFTAWVEAKLLKLNFARVLQRTPAGVS